MLQTTACALVAMLGAASAWAQPEVQHDPTMQMGRMGHIGASVMPFDLARSTHVFTPTADGGTKDVVSMEATPSSRP